MGSPVELTTRKPRKSMDAIDANGNGNGVDIGGWQTIGMQVVEGGTVTTGTVTLELSIDGVTWHTTAVVWDASTDADGEIMWSVDTPAAYARVVLASLTGGGNVTVYITGA